MYLGLAPDVSSRSSAERFLISMAAGNMVRYIRYLKGKNAEIPNTSQHKKEVPRLHCVLFVLRPQAPGADCLALLFAQPGNYLLAVPFTNMNHEPQLCPRRDAYPTMPMMVTRSMESNPSSSASNICLMNLTGAMSFSFLNQI